MYTELLQHGRYLAVENRGTELKQLLVKLTTVPGYVKICANTVYKELIMKKSHLPGYKSNKFSSNGKLNEKNQIDNVVMTDENIDMVGLYSESNRNRYVMDVSEEISEAKENSTPSIVTHKWTSKANNSRNSELQKINEVIDLELIWLQNKLKGASADYTRETNEENM